MEAACVDFLCICELHSPMAQGTRYQTKELLTPTDQNKKDFLKLRSAHAEVAFRVAFLSCVLLLPVDGDHGWDFVPLLRLKLGVPIHPLPQSGDSCLHRHTNIHKVIIHELSPTLRWVPAKW